MPNSHFFESDDLGDVLIISPRKDIPPLADDTSDASWDDLMNRAGGGQVKYVVFDFRRVEYFGSSMLEAMLALWKKISPGGGKMAVCNASKTVRDILHVSKFHTLWPICDTRDEAVDQVRETS